MVDVLAVIFIFGGGTLFLLAVSPVGRALADRIRGSSASTGNPAVLAELDQLRQEVAEVQQLRTEVAELHERVDFTERLLAQPRQPGLVRDPVSPPVAQRDPTRRA